MKKLTIAIMLLSTSAFSGKLLIIPEQEPLNTYANRLIETQYKVVNTRDSIFNIKHILFKVGTYQLAVLYRDTTKQGCDNDTTLLPGYNCTLFVKAKTFDFEGNSPYSIRFCQDDKYYDCYTFTGNIDV